MRTIIGWRLSFVVRVLCAALVFLGSMPVVARPIGPPSTEQERHLVVRALGDLAGILDEARQGLPRTTFDPGTVLAAAGREPENLFAWVRDETALVAYAGALRGPAGVLMDRDGNALDRALLLDRLLTLAGHRTRLARGRLGPDQARVLAGEARTPPAPATAGVPASGALDAELEGVVDTARDRVAWQSAELLERLAPLRPSAEAAREEDLRRATVALADHWWVQFERSGGWLDLDPSLPEPGRVRVAAEATLAAGELPADLWHRVTLRLILETRGRGRPREATLVELAAPVAEFVNRTIHVGHAPLGLDPAALAAAADGPARLDRAGRAGAWLPLITAGDRVVRGSLFTAAGEVLPADDAALARFANAPSGAASTASGAIQDAVPRILDGLLGAFDGRRPPPAPPPSQVPADAVTAEWLEYELAVPGEAPRRIRRAVFDLVGPVARAAGEEAPPRVDAPAARARTAGLIGETLVRVDGAKPSGEAVLAKLAGELQALGPLLDRLGQPAPASDAPGPPGPAGASTEARGHLPRLATLQADLDALSLVRWAWNRDRGALYVHAPNVFALRRDHRAAAPDDWRDTLAIDIVANDVAVRPSASVDPFAARLVQGVVDTAAEAALVGGSPPGAAMGPPVNAAVLHDLAQVVGVERVTLHRAGASAPAGTGLPPEAAARIAADVAAGQVVVVPASPFPVADRQAVAWWRVDPRSGATLGVGADGTGQAAVEYMGRLGRGLGVVMTAIDLVEFAICTGSAVSRRAGADAAACVFVVVVERALGFGLGRAVPFVADAAGPAARGVRRWADDRRLGVPVRHDRAGVPAVGTGGVGGGGGNPPRTSLGSNDPDWTDYTRKATVQDLDDYAARIKTITAGLRSRDAGSALDPSDIEVEGTIAVGRTNIPELSDLMFEGASTLALRQQGKSGVAEPGPFLSPQYNSQFINHAEEDFLNKFYKAVEKRAEGDVDPALKGAAKEAAIAERMKEVLKDRELLIRVRHPRGAGVCSSCTADLPEGSEPKMGPGILAQTRKHLPGLDLRFVVDNPRPGLSPKQREFVVHDGKYKVFE